MKVHGFHRGVRRGYVGRAHCGKIVRCVTTDFGAVDCLKCMAAVLGLKLAKAVLEKRRERTNAMLAKCAAEIADPRAEAVHLVNSGGQSTVCGIARGSQAGVAVVWDDMPELVTCRACRDTRDVEAAAFARRFAEQVPS